MRVYFIRCESFVKIGAAACPATRLAQLQLANPQTLTLLGTVEGGRELERRLHAMFSKFHHRGEWYEMSSAIYNYITEFCIDQQMEIKRRGKYGRATKADAAAIARRYDI
jgi:hypothetical protein